MSAAYALPGRSSLPQQHAVAEMSVPAATARAAIILHHRLAAALQGSSLTHLVGRLIGVRLDP